MAYRTQQLWTSGRRDGLAHIIVTIYDNGVIIAASDQEKITEHQMRSTLGREFPGVEFSVSQGRGDGLFMEGHHADKD